ncbi:Uncharacterised protein [uncultured archaeon]|nr:Uncharacterised protein [uncultured archaeon]
MGFLSSLLKPFQFVERKLKEATKRRLAPEDMAFIKKRGQVQIKRNLGSRYVEDVFGTHDGGYIHTRATTRSPTGLLSSSVITRIYNEKGELKRRLTERYGGLRHNVTRKEVRYKPNGRLFGRRVSTNPSQLKIPQRKR